MKKRILFLCIGNSCRSQMAEGTVNHLMDDKYEAFSAGSKPSSVNQRAVKAMAEIGIDISQNKSKHVDIFNGQEFDIVVTVCDDNDKSGCPMFTGKAGKRFHWPFPDPAAAVGTEEDIMVVFRHVRDVIVDKLKREL